MEDNRLDDPNRVYRLILNDVISELNLNESENSKSRVERRALVSARDYDTLDDFVDDVLDDCLDIEAQDTDFVIFYVKAYTALQDWLVWNLLKRRSPFCDLGKDVLQVFSQQHFSKSPHDNDKQYSSRLELSSYIYKVLKQVHPDIGISIF